MSERVLAQAIVDPGPAGGWTVTVTAKPPYDKEIRIYRLTAKSDNDAAFEGMRLFCEEMQNLNCIDDQLA